VSVFVAGKKEIDEVGKRISDNGTLSLPLLGTIATESLTLDEFCHMLAALYKRYYVNPQVIAEFSRDTGPEGISPWGYVTVLGRVKSPGRIAIPATRDLTVSGAIQKAGGFNTSAKLGGVIITHRGLDGKTATRAIDFEAVGSGGKTEDDIIVNADDMVFVPERKF
jgi:polysaccharide biosynthesis/export protein